MLTFKENQITPETLCWGRWAESVLRGVGCNPPLPASKLPLRVHKPLSVRIHLALRRVVIDVGDALGWETLAGGRVMPPVW